MSDYAEFLWRKTHSTADGGFETLWAPDELFDFQRAVLDWTLRRGRSAALLDCGLGKSPIELAWCENIARKTDKPALLLTPLAVTPQMLGEAEKFGVEAARSREGEIPARVVVTNYERLHYFDPDKFGGVAADECFPRGTLVDTPNGPQRIETVQIGETVCGATGTATVTSTHKREVKGAVKITLGRKRIISSPSHAYFTARGWIAADQLVSGDFVMETGTAVRLVRRGVLPAISSATRAAVLRHVLLSEMENEPSGLQGADLHARTTGEDNRRDQGMAPIRLPGGDCQQGEDSAPQSEPRSGGATEDFGPIEGDGVGATNSRRQRPAANRGGSRLAQRIRGWVDNQLRRIVRQEDSRLSIMLQAGRSQSSAADRRRGGRILALQSARTGRQERYEAGFARVDGVAILECGHPDLERYRDAAGTLDFYDLGVARHPSYSVSGLLVHNSSAIKAFDGTRRAQVTAFMRKVPYRLLGTATAAPNDYIELGTSSEALGLLGHIDMLNRFFRNEQNNSATGRQWGGAARWRFKGHAELPFWRWVCSWARAARKPEDLGFDGSAFILPPLTEREHVVAARTLPEGMLFPAPALTLPEQREERRRTINERCERVADLVNRTGQPALVWCHLNDEGDLLECLIPDAVQVSGSDSDDAKEERMLAFANGGVRVLVTKPKIGAWGMNFQRCAHVVMFPSHSWEMYYQGIRRAWRFGQQREVVVDIVTTEGEARVLANLQRKARQADEMFSRLVAEMHRSQGVALSNGFVIREEVPSWL